MCEIAAWTTVRTIFLYLIQASLTYLETVEWAVGTLPLQALLSIWHKTWNSVHLTIRYERFRTTMRVIRASIKTGTFRQNLRISRSNPSVSSLLSA